ncbi:MAG: hypothetical protein ACYC9R_12215 [Nitrosotalea sp.]
MMNHSEVKQLIYDMCDSLRVPQIPVFKVFEIDGDPNIVASFYSSGWYIEYTKRGATKETLQHEITHYVIALIKAAEMAEEKICDSVRL